MHLFPNFISQLFFPAQCPLCKQDLPTGGGPLCVLCKGRLQSTYFWGFPLSRRYVRRFFALGSYESLLRELIVLFKFGRRDYLASFMMKTLSDRVESLKDQVDVIVPVPMAPWKQWQRGYNQSALLADELGKLWNRPVRGKILKRRWWSHSQIPLRRAQRLVNAEVSYYLVGKLNSLRHQKVLLVDDVCTTGATLNACARLLQQAGAAEVSVIAVAVEEPGRAKA